MLPKAWESFYFYNFSIIEDDLLACYHYPVQEQLEDFKAVKYDSIQTALERDRFWSDYFKLYGG